MPEDRDERPRESYSGVFKYLHFKKYQLRRVTKWEFSTSSGISSPSLRQTDELSDSEPS